MVRTIYVHYSFKFDEDLIETTVNDIYLSLDKYKGEYDSKNFYWWVRTITHNEYVNEWRKRKIAKHSPNMQGNNDISELYWIADTSDEDILEKEEFENQLEDLLIKLIQHDTINQKIIIDRLHGLKYDDIAKKHGLPLGTVKSKIHQAIKKLKAQYGIEQT